MGDLIPFPRRRFPPGGVVYVCPCEDDGGSWAVDHQSAPGKAATRLRTFISFYGAEGFAQAEAQRIGAVYDDGVDGGAA